MDWTIGPTAHLQSRRKALITQESQNFSQTWTTTVNPFHDFLIYPHPSTIVTMSTLLHIPAILLLSVDILDLNVGNAHSIVERGGSERSDVDRRCRGSGKSGDTGGSSSARGRSSARGSSSSMGRSSTRGSSSARGRSSARGSSSARGRSSGGRGNANRRGDNSGRSAGRRCRSGT
jgi:hypothetical protein